MQLTTQVITRNGRRTTDELRFAIEAADVRNGSVKFKFPVQFKAKPRPSSRVQKLSRQGGAALVEPREGAGPP